MAPWHCELVERTHRRGGESAAFTLIELFVVMAVVGILLGLAFPAFTSVQNSARKTQAKNDLVQIVTAVNAYYTEYGKYPLAASDGSADTLFGTSLGNENLFNVLRANGVGRDEVNASDTSGNKNLNLRRIVFISPPNVKDTAAPRSGIGVNNQFYDPWGIPYLISLDGDYSNAVKIGTALQYNDLTYTQDPPPSGPAAVRSGVIAASYGSDKAKGTKTPASSNLKGSDDVVSWQ